MSLSTNLSYIVPRDPSIKSWDDRVKLPFQSDQNNKFKLDLDSIDENFNEKLKVYLRIKPSNKKCNTYSVSNHTLEAHPPEDSVTYKNLTNKVGALIHKFHFTSVLKDDSPQEQVFEKCVLDSLIRFIGGENDLLFAFGTTNAGKTYTMQGTTDEPGVIPRALQFIFNSLKDNIELYCQYQPRHYNDLCYLEESNYITEKMHKNFILNLDLGKYERQLKTNSRNYRIEATMSSSGNSDSYQNATFREMESNCTTVHYKVSDDRYAVWISMIEIYNEQIYDLLQVSDEKGVRQKLRFAEDEQGNVYIKNLRYINVASAHEAYQIFQFGKANLHLAPTALNNRSSRSHCIFTMTLARFLDIGKSSHALISRHSFCDLAGMERVKKTLNIGCRLAESKSINTSLSVFTKCINVLKDNQCSGERKPVPYRESKLTRLFKYAMMGKEKLSLIICITQEPILFDETIKVLKFSAMAQQIVPVNAYGKNVRLKALRNTRFSTLVSKVDDTSKIIWGASTIVNVENNDQTNALDDVLNIIDKLKEELAQERKKAQNIEKEVRNELTSKFAEIIRQQNELSSNHLQNETRRMEDMYERRRKRLIDFYEKEKERYKMRRIEDDSEETWNKIQEMETELKLLKSENTSLREMVQSLGAHNNKLQSRYTRLEFDYSDKTRLLRLYETKEADGNEADYVRELETQLKESQLKVKELQELLDESAVDYKDLLENHKCIKEENENLLNEIAVTSTSVDDLKSELSECERMLAVKTEYIEQLENNLEKFSKIKLTAELDREMLKKCEQDKLDFMKKHEESEIKIQQLEKALTEKASEIEALSCEKLGIESLVKNLKEKITFLEGKVDMIKNNEVESIRINTNVEEENYGVGIIDFKNLTKHYDFKTIACSKAEYEIQLLRKDVNSERRNLTIKVKELTDNETIMERESNEEKQNISFGLPSNNIGQNIIPLRERNEKTKLSLDVQPTALHSNDETLQLNQTMEEDVRGSQFKRLESPQTDVNGKKDEIDIFVNLKEKSEFTDCRKDSTPSVEKEIVKNYSNANYLAMQIEKLSLLNSESKKSSKKADDTVHPSLIKNCRSTRRGKKQKKNDDVKADEIDENLPSDAVKGIKCNKKLFCDNDFDNIGDLDSSFIEPEIRRLRPRKK